jgi:uncharacterized DUF497 family protein
MNHKRECNECVFKHLGSAYVLYEETRNGYPEDRILVIGHLDQAASHCFTQEQREMIRELRKKYQDTGDLEYADITRIASSLGTEEPITGI